MFHPWFSVAVTFALFGGMIGMLILGSRIGARRLKEDPENYLAGLGAIDAAVFALLGLMIAFTFSGAATRFDERRTLIVEEANDIGTAYLRIDLLPAGAQPELRQMMRDYADSRLRTYRVLPDIAASNAELARLPGLQAEIWNAAVSATRLDGVPTTVAMLLLPALNNMIDITSTRTMATLRHPPMAVWLMLFGLSLIAAVLAGHAMASSKSRSKLHILVFPAVMAAVVNVVLDIEHPRLGIITVNSFDQAIADARAAMD